jgi:hypothetical protein
VKSLCTGTVNSFGSFAELQCPWCPEGGCCAVRIRRWVSRWALHMETNMRITIPFHACDVHAKDLSLFNPLFWQQLMHLCQEKKARISPEVVPISARIPLTTLAYQCAPARPALQVACCAVYFSSSHSHAYQFACYLAVRASRILMWLDVQA